jgi:predicted transcriptional regulator
MGKYRDRLQIIADILSVVRGGAKKTHVMYRANLSFTLLKRYLTEVLEAGLVRCDDEECYSLTGRGERFLDRFVEYSERCERVEEELNNVNNDKTVLESLVGGDSSKRVDERVREKKVR